MKTTELLYVELCKAMDKQVKARTVMPSDMYDAAIVFLATVSARARDPNTDYESFVKVTLRRVEVAIRETDSLVSARHN